MQEASNSPMIYNLFPRLVGPMEAWPEHAERAQRMGFDWIFINPIQYPGFSGSLYAIKDFYRLNPAFVSPGVADEMGALRDLLVKLHDLGLKVMMDLVVNHTSKDSPLIKEYPRWFRWDKKGNVVSPSAIDPADSRNVTVWGDLAEVDNAGSEERQSLWAYWTALVQYYSKLGFDGFRCDAAYKVPAKLWEQLIFAARVVDPQSLFVAETLGCKTAEVRGLASAGFDLLFNSSKWWNFDAPWCLEQHEEFGAIAPSVAFAESHDTPRLMEESGGLLTVQRQRYAFSALFSAGVMMPIGYEYGFTRKLDVVSTTPEDWERTDIDLSGYIASVNKLVREIPVLSVEGLWDVATDLKRATCALRKSSPGTTPIFALINKDWRHPQTFVMPPDLADSNSMPKYIVRLGDDTPAQMPLSDKAIVLQPAEVAILR